MKKICFIAQFPPPMHGLSKAVETLYNSNLNFEIDSQGEFEFEKVDITNNKNFIKNLLKISRSKADLFYFTISQTKGGNLRDLVIFKLLELQHKKCLIHLHGGYYRQLVDNDMAGWQRKANYKATIANITVIGYISLIINAFMNNHFGFMLLKISGDALAQKNGYIRIVDCAVFTPLVIAYLFSNSVVHNRKLDFFKMCIVLLGQIYVEKTRMGTIALLFMLIAMLLFSKKNKFSKILTWIFLILGGFFSIAGGMIDQILSKFSIQNNGNSTLYRLNEIQFYMSHFIENKLLGIGIISPEKIMNEYGIAYWQNHNYEDIGIIGFLGIAGIVGIIVIYIIPIIRMLFVLQSVKGKISSYSEYLMLIGMFCYIIVTSATLMIVNYQRMPCFAICIALFEYIYVSCNKLEMKGIHKCY